MFFIDIIIEYKNLKEEKIMKKSKKIILRLIPVLLLVLVVFVNVPVLGFSEFEGGDYDIESGDAGSLGTAINNLWAVISTILKIAAVAAIIFAGVRYMFASADSKADIKKSMLVLVVGAILVFGASFVVDLITVATGEITGQG